MLEPWQGRVPPHDWHVLRGGSGPLIVFLHGAGASSGSFTGVTQHLAPNWTVLAPDLPGHGQTRVGARGRYSLDRMAEDIATLVQSFDTPVHAIVGHSAGGAIALRAADHLTPKGCILINAALASFDGIAGWAFPGLARTLRDLPFAPTLLAGRLGKRENIERLLRANGEEPSEEMVTRYQDLAASPKHIAGTLAMMGQWKLNGLLADLPKITTETDLIAAASDQVVPPDVSRTAAARLPNAHLTEIPGGHLVHEVRPADLASLIEQKAQNWLKTPD